MLCLRFLALAGVVSAGHVAVPFTRERYHVNLPSSIARRQNGESDDGLLVRAVNNMTGGGYYAEFGVGSPAQTVGFLLDTGSSDTWVNSRDAELCNSRLLQAQVGHCMDTFDSDESDTFEIVDRNGFNISYLDGRSIQGSYFEDTFHIGDEKIEGLQMGLALDSVRPSGILGLGFSRNVASRRQYPALVESMVDAGLIDSQAFSLYLNTIESSDGNILFGAIDQKKFIGDLAILDLHADAESGSDDIYHFNVEFNGFNIVVPDDEDPIDKEDLEPGAYAILDSGSTINLLPSSQVSGILDFVGAATVRGLIAPFVDCAWGKEQGEGYEFEFEFDGKTITVPMREMIVDAFPDVQDELMADPEAQEFAADWEGICMFGMASTEDLGFEGDEFALLGDTFLRSAYVVYDISNEQLGIAQANYNSNETDIVEITEGDLPDVSGVKSQSSPAPTRGSGGSSDEDDDDDDDDGASSSSSSSSGGDGPVTRTVTMQNSPTGDSSGDDGDDGNGDSEDDEDAAVLLSNPFGSGVPAVATFMGLMSAVMFFM